MDTPDLHYLRIYPEWLRQDSYKLCRLSLTLPQLQVGQHSALVFRVWMSLIGMILLLLLGRHEFKYLTLSWVSISEREWFGFFTTSCKNHGVVRWSKMKNHLDHKCIWWCYTSYLIILEWIVLFFYWWQENKKCCVFKSNTHKQYFFVFSLKSYVNVEWRYDITFSSIKCPLLVMLFQKPVAKVCITSART